MTIIVHRKAGRFVATDSEVGVSGFGDTEAEARENLAKKTAELHRRLREADRLGPHMARILETLNERAKD